MPSPSEPQARTHVRGSDETTAALRCAEEFHLAGYPLFFECQLERGHFTMCHHDSDPNPLYRKKEGRFTINWWPEEDLR